MRKFVADSRTITLNNCGGDLKIGLVVSGVTRLPRKIKKKIKSMSKRVSTVEYLRYIAENEF